MHQDLSVKVGLTGLGIPRKLVELCFGCVCVSRAALTSQAGLTLRAEDRCCRDLGVLACLVIQTYPSSPEFLVLTMS